MGNNDMDDAREILFKFNPNPEKENVKKLYKSIAEETFDMYTAYMEAGFSSQQAFELVLSMCVSNAGE